MDSNDILARLRQGEDIDSIAKEITAALNAANNAYEKERADAKRREEEKRADAQELCHLLNAFVEEYYDDIPAGDPLSPDDLIALVDGIADLFRSFQKVESKVNPVVTKVKESKDDFTAAIDDVLDKFVRG